MARRTQKYGVMIAGFDGIDQQMVYVDENGALRLAGGSAVDGAAASGNPIPVGGIYNSTKPTYDNLDRTQLQSDTRGNIGVTINVTDTATPLAMGAIGDAATNGAVGVYTIGRNTGYNGTTWDRLRSAIGAVLVNTGIGSLSVEEGGRLFNNIKLAAPTTTVVKSGPGHLHALIINTPLASGVITMYDNTAASGTEIGIITNPGTLLSTGPETILYDIAFATGLTVVTSGAAQNVTVSYR